jgi:6,7-dimethyl-8-ribityllumazine synthase
MTSSDLTLLPADAKARTASRVGQVLDAPGGTAPGGTAPGIRIGFACAEFNGGITFRLLMGALDALEESGADLDDVALAWVPGAFELPLVAQRLAESDTVDAVVCLGAVIRGDTGHYEFVAGECASGLQRVQLDTGKPIVFGVLTTETVDQALVRSSDDHANKGREAALTAVRTAGVLDAVSAASRSQRVGFSMGGR